MGRLLVVLVLKVSKGRKAKAGSFSYSYANLADVIDALHDALVNAKLGVMQTVRKSISLVRIG